MHTQCERVRACVDARVSGGRVHVCARACMRGWRQVPLGMLPPIGTCMAQMHRDGPSSAERAKPRLHERAELGGRLELRNEPVSADESLPPTV